MSRADTRAAASRDDGAHAVAGAGEDDVGAPAREDPALDDARDRLQLGLEPLGVAQVEAVDVDDGEAVVGDVARA